MRKTPVLTMVPFVPDHLADLRALAGRASYEVLRQEAVTVCDAEGPLCCFGIASPWPGFGIVWCEERDTATMRQHGRHLGLVMRRYWMAWLEAGQFRRLETRVPLTHEASQRLVTWLGFQQTGVKPHYGPEDETMIEYVLYPERG